MRRTRKPPKSSSLVLLTSKKLPINKWGVSVVFTLEVHTVVRTGADLARVIRLSRCAEAGDQSGWREYLRVRSGRQTCLRIVRGGVFLEVLCSKAGLNRVFEGSANCSSTWSGTLNNK